jgi:pimeloyl-ACP methyl ester carboxylesterase
MGCLVDIDRFFNVPFNSHTEITILQVNYMNFKIRIIAITLIVLGSTTLIGCNILYYKFNKSHSLGIESLEKLNIGGIEQWILIRGQNSSNPVMLILHGGPGSPLFSEVPKYSKLEEHFVVVYWEQRGTAKSYNSKIPIETMTLDQFILDTHELISNIKLKFNVSGVYLMGRSWGSVLGLNVAHRYPDDLIAYIGIAQFVNGLQNDFVSHQHTITMAEQLGDLDALEKLKEIGDPPWDMKSLLYQRKKLTKYGGVIYNQKKRESANIDRIQSVLMSPYYSISTILTLIFNPYFSVKHLWSDVYKTDFTTQIKKIDVPVFFFHGKHDYMVSVKLTGNFNHISS